LTSLCTVHKELPQGAPTSPALLDAVLFPLDVELAATAHTAGLTYTRYMDDIFVSGNQPLGDFESTVRTAVGNRGLRLGRDKTHFWGPGERPTLAGVVLGSSLSPRPEDVAALVALIGRLTLSRDPRLARKVQGHLAWINSISPTDAAQLQRMLDAIAGA
jgi:RNA-directed DNA polymerase